MVKDDNLPQRSGDNNAPQYPNKTIETAGKPRYGLGADVVAPRLRKLMFFSVALLAAFIVGLGGGWLGAELHRSSVGTDSQRQLIIDESRLIGEVAEVVGPSVVSVNVTSTTEETLFGPRTRQAVGTGFIISEDGMVVTNRHVVPGDNPEVTLTLSDGTELDDVEVVGRTGEEDSLDVAFLKINDSAGKELRPAALGDSSEVRVGDRVIAIGNALGQFQNTVTSGIISGFGRDVDARDRTSQRLDSLQNLFQTDAAINPGNSGGPLVNIDGKVIGINTAVAGGAQNIGFAIPINDVADLIAQVLEDGEFQRPFLGVHYVSLTDDLAFHYGLEAKRGAYILPIEETGEPGVLPGSPAAEADLREGDIIITIEGEEINERNSLVSLLRRHRVGEEIILTIIRGGEEITLNVTLAPTPED